MKDSLETRFYHFIDTLTESEGFKTLCAELNVDQMRELTPEEELEAGLGMTQLFSAFGGFQGFEKRTAPSRSGSELNRDNPKLSHNPYQNNNNYHNDGSYEDCQ